MPGAVREDVADRDVLLAVAARTRGCTRRRGSSRCRSRSSSSLWITIAVTAFDAEKMLNGVSGVRRPWRVRGVLRRVAGRVTDGPVEHDLAVAADAELDRRMDAAPVERARGLPDALDGLARRGPRLGRRLVPRLVTSSRLLGTRQRLSEAKPDPRNPGERVEAAHASAFSPRLRGPRSAQQREHGVAGPRGIDRHAGFQRRDRAEREAEQHRCDLLSLDVGADVARGLASTTALAARSVASPTSATQRSRMRGERVQVSINRWSWIARPAPGSAPAKPARVSARSCSPLPVDHARRGSRPAPAPSRRR